MRCGLWGGLSSLFERLKGQRKTAVPTEEKLS
jgi:branched-chain amino acid transport system permease protein